jgi:hypothetical protein
MERLFKVEQTPRRGRIRSSGEAVRDGWMTGFSRFKPADGHKKKSND